MSKFSLKSELKQNFIFLIIRFINKLIGNKIEKPKFTYLKNLQIYIIFTIGIPQFINLSWQLY